jgi:adenosylcobinamide-GDP ribazoletransferase
MNRQLGLFFLAVQFLTRLPTPAVVPFEADLPARSLPYFPLVGALIGLVNVGIWWICLHGVPVPVAVGIMLSASLLLTGALHEDGFTDACDGFGGGRTSEAVLTIMKDSRLGAYGAIGITMLLGMRWVVLTSLPGAALPLTVVAAQMTSRWFAVALIWKLPYVRTGEQTKSRPFTRSMRGIPWLSGGVLGMLGVIPVAWVTHAGVRLVVSVIVGTLAAALVAWLAGVYFKRRLGGYTGDCLGATQQIAEITLLLTTLCAMGSYPVG